MRKPQFTVYPLCQVRQFMKKDFYIQLPTHMSLKFNQEVSWSMRTTNNITVSIDMIPFQSTMKNIHVNLMTWIICFQKPGGNILTESLRITVSRMADGRHDNQCVNQTRDEMNRSASLSVMQRHQ